MHGDTRRNDQPKKLMQERSNSTTHASAAIVMALAANMAAAQVTPMPPDAGTLSNINRPPPAAAAPKAPTLDIQQEIRPPLVTPGGAKVRVQSFSVTGNTVFPSERLEALLAPYVGKELDLAGLDEAASLISQFYRRNGYFVARAYLPAQDVSSGRLQVAVIEGRLGAVKVKRAPGMRLREDVVDQVVTNAAKPGTPISERNVERGLLLLNDMPGVEVKSTLVPGATPGTSDLVVEASESARVNGSVDADNFGNRYTGVARVGGTLNFNDLSGRGDQITTRFTTSGSGMQFLRGAYITPVGSVGTKLGIAGSTLHYKLGKEFSPLDAHGTADVLSAYAIHPFLRTRNASTYGTISFDKKRLKDDQLGRNTDDKDLDVLNLGLSGDMRDNAGGGGISSASITLTSGRLGLGRNAVFAAADALTGQTAGRFSKLMVGAARLQRIDDNWGLYVNFSAQTSNKNLDSSEKFILGGQGVRAYPQGEAAGDAGALLNIEGRYTMPSFEYGTMQLVTFFDYGSVRLHHTPWLGWQPVGRPNFPNSYSLKGAGFGANLFARGGLSLRASVAWKIGSNPGADALGRDSDTTDKNPRLWLQASKQF